MPGARISWRVTPLVDVDIVTMCQQVTPEQWIAEVRLGLDPLFTSAVFDSRESAGRWAEKELIRRIASLLRDPFTTAGQAETDGGRS